MLDIIASFIRCWRQVQLFTDSTRFFASKKRKKFFSYRSHCSFRCLHTFDTLFNIVTAWSCNKATTKGFEPSRAEPNGFRVHLLNHSDTLSCMQAGRRHFETKHFDARPTTCYEHNALHILAPPHGGTKNALHILVPPHGGTKNVLHVLVTTFARSKGRGRRGRGGKERGWQGWQGCGGRSPRETVYNVYDSKGCDAKQWMRKFHPHPFIPILS